MTKHFQDNVLGRYEGTQLSGKANAENLRHGKVEGLSGHGHGDVEAAGTDGQHSHGAGCRRVRVAPQKSLARFSEALDMQLVADAVAGRREEDAVPGRHILEIAVVVGVAEVPLDHVVVDVADGKLRPDPVDAHGLELEAGHRPRGILGQRLVHPDTDSLPLDHFPLDKMGPDDFLCDRSSHRSPSSCFRGHRKGCPLFGETALQPRPLLDLKPPLMPLPPR